MTDSQADQTSYDILIVDDSPMSRQLLTYIVEMRGYHVRTAANGPEALALAQDNPPDLVLLDIMMPEMSGFEVAQKLKAAPETHDVPIIFISALSDERSKVQAFDAGGVDYVSKPFQTKEVLARVNTHLELRKATQRLQQQIVEREKLIAKLDTVNEQLRQEIAEREAAQRARESSLQLLREALSRTEALYRITRSLITSEDIPDMLQSVTVSVAQALPADGVFTVTIDLDAEEITYFAKGGVEFEGLTCPSYAELMAGLSGWVIQRVQPALSPKDVSDPRESREARQWRESMGIGAMLVVPLYYQGRMMGTMTAMNRVSRPDFDERDLAQLSAIAGQVSVALANARLSEETSYLKEFNEGIVQGVAEVILVTDQEQRITFANPAAVAMLGYSLNELIGKPCAMLFFSEIESERDQKAMPCQSGLAARFETLLQSRDGQHVPVLASIRPLYQGGEFAGSLAALTDITELKQAEERLRQYAMDLEARNAELDAFSHTVAHDLRNPLTGIIGFIDLLQTTLEEREDKGLLEYVQYIYRNTAKMNNIIDELLLLASVRAVDEVRAGPLDMVRIVHEAQSRLDYLIDEYGAQVLVADAWPQAIGYTPWVEEVWVNYLSNAVKYGGRPEKGIPPKVELGYDDSPSDTCDGDVAPMVRFWVRDNGPGLTPEEQARLFTPFERLHNVHAEGHGLGLSIVRRIVEKLGGEVGVESVPGQGSTFYFTLPRA